MATSKLFPLFPIPVSVYNFGQESHQLNLSLVDDILTERKNNSGVIRSNMGGWHSKTKMEEKYESFSLLKQQITLCVNRYIEEIGFESGLEVDKLWTNINKTGDFNIYHDHPGSICTGCYYPVNEIVNGKANYDYKEDVSLKPSVWDGKKGGSLVLHDPSYGQKGGLSVKKKKEPGPYSLENYHLYPTAGVLVIFPAYLFHTVCPFKDKKTRVSISFCTNYPDGTN